MHASFLRWFVTVLHRRAGKTTGWLNHHQRAAMNDTWETKRLRTLEPSFTDAEIRELLRERIYAHILPTWAMQDDLDLIQNGLMTQEEYDQEWFLSPHAAIKGCGTTKN